MKIDFRDKTNEPDIDEMKMCLFGFGLVFWFLVVPLGLLFLALMVSLLIGVARWILNTGVFEWLMTLGHTV